MLRASGRHADKEFDLAGVFGDRESDVPGADVLLPFVDALLRGGDVTAARDAVRIALGEAALSDAAAVIGGFDGITRIADATGIPMEPEKAAANADFFAALDIGRFRREKV